MAYDPTAPDAIRQFEIEPWIALKLFGVDVLFTNSSSAILVTTLAVVAFILAATRRPQMVPGRLQSAAERVYDFVARMVVGAAGGGASAYLVCRHALLRQERRRGALSDLSG